MKNMFAVAFSTRETHTTEMLEREVYAKGRKALFFAGGSHLGRGGAGPAPAAATAEAAGGSASERTSQGSIRHESNN